MDFIALGYTGLFLAGFLSATIIPLNSELVLLALLAQDFDPWICLLIGTLGNSLGGLTNYFLGRLGDPRWFQRFGVSEKKLNSFEEKIKRFGFWMAFLSWVPIAGDPLTIALGFFRVSFWKVTVLLILGKLLRYLVLIIPFL